MKSFLNKTIFMVLYLFCTLFIKVNGQIVYSDQNPDDSVRCTSPSSITCSNSLNLDINSDGAFDFLFQYSYHHTVLGTGICARHVYTKSCFVYPKDLNGIASDSLRPLCLAYASLIDSGIIWTDTSIHASSNSLSYNYTKPISHCLPSSPAINTITGNWYNHSDEYLGVYIIENGLKYYGWIRLTVIAATDIIIKDYAYNSTPDESILAGDSGNISSGIIYHSLSKSEFSVYPNPAKNNITVYSEQPGELQLINHLGQIIYSEQINESENLIDISNFPSGIYIVRLCENQNVWTKKISITN